MDHWLVDPVQYVCMFFAVVLNKLIDVDYIVEIWWASYVAKRFYDFMIIC